MAYFGKTRDKKSHDHDVGEKAKSHPFVYQARFAESTGNYACAKSPIIDREFCPIHRNVQPGRVKEGSM